MPELGAVFVRLCGRGLTSQNRGNTTTPRTLLAHRRPERKNTWNTKLKLRRQKDPKAIMVRVTEYSQTVTVVDSAQIRGPRKVLSQTQGFARLIAKNCHSLRQVESPPQLQQPRKAPAYKCQVGSRLNPVSSRSNLANDAPAPTAQDTAESQASHDAAYIRVPQPYGIEGGTPGQYGAMGQLPQGALPRPESNASTGHYIGSIELAQQRGQNGGQRYPILEVESWSSSSAQAPQDADRRSQTRPALPVRHLSAFHGQDNLQNLNRDDVLSWLGAEVLGDNSNG